MLILSNRYGIKCLIDLLQLEPSSVMLKVISDIMPHWYDLRNTIVIVSNFCNGKKIICELQYVYYSNRHGTKFLINLLQLEQ